MSVSYKKLLMLLTDKDMKIADLRRATGLSFFAFSMMTRGIGGVVEFRSDEVAAK